MSKTSNHKNTRGKIWNVFLEFGSRGDLPKQHTKSRSYKKKDEQIHINMFKPLENERCNKVKQSAGHDGSCL